MNKEVKRVPAWIPSNLKTRKVVVAFVLSCPGQEEMLKGKPCAGKTGEIMDRALEILTKKRQNLFPSKDRYDYPIINSSDIVHYNELKNGTEPDEFELEDPTNIAAFEKQLKKSEATLLILCGFRAQHICKKLPIKKIRKPESRDKSKMRALNNYVNLPETTKTISIYHPSYLHKQAKGNKIESAAQIMARDIDIELGKLGF